MRFKKNIKKLLLLCSILSFAVPLHVFSSIEQTIKQGLTLQPGKLSGMLIQNALKAQTKLTELRHFQKQNPLLSAASIFGGLYIAGKTAENIPGVRSIKHEWDRFILGSWGKRDSFLSQAGKWTGLLVNDLPLAVLAEGAFTYALTNGFGLALEDAKPMIAPLYMSYALSRILYKRQLIPANLLGQPLGDSGDASLAEGVYRSSTYIPKSAPRMTPEELIASCSEHKLRRVVKDMQQNKDAGGRLLLIGESNLGKTFWSEQLANTLERNAVILNANEALFQGKFYGEVNEKFKALQNIADYYRLKKGDVIIIDEIDNFILKNSGNDEAHHTNMRKMVMNFLDEMTSQGFVVIMISNKKEYEIHEQVANRAKRLAKDNGDGKLTQDVFEAAKNSLEDLTTSIFNPSYIYMQEGQTPIKKNRQKNFGWGLVEKEYPNLLARIQICDNIINAHRQGGNRCFITDQDALTTYVAHKTAGLDNGAVTNVINEIIATETINLADSNDKNMIDRTLQNHLEKQKNKLFEAYTKAYEDLTAKEPDRAKWEDIAQADSDSDKKQELLGKVIIAEHNLNEFCRINNLEEADLETRESTEPEKSSLLKNLKESLQSISTAHILKNKTQKQLLKDVPQVHAQIYKCAQKLLLWSEKTLDLNFDSNTLPQKENATVEDVKNFIALAIQQTAKAQKEKLIKNNPSNIEAEKMRDMLRCLEFMARQEKSKQLSTLRAQTYRLLTILEQLKTTPKHTITLNNKTLEAENTAEELYRKYFAGAKRLTINQIRAIGRLYAHKEGEDFKKLVLDHFGVNAIARRILPEIVSHGVMSVYALGLSTKHSINELTGIISPKRYKRTIIRSEDLIGTKLRANGLNNYLGYILPKTATMDLARAAAQAKYILTKEKDISATTSWEEAARNVKAEDDIFFGPDNKLMLRKTGEDSVYLEHYLITL